MGYQAEENLNTLSCFDAMHMCDTRDRQTDGQTDRQTDTG